MNQAQRKFLIDRIESEAKARIAAIKNEQIPQPPSLENYVYGLALTGKLEIQPTEYIKEYFCKKAMGHSSDRYSETWLGTSQGDMVNRAKVKIGIKDIFVLPKEYNDMWDEYYKSKAELDEKIHAINVECSSLTTRIQLASDKTLDRMISEVDDMGDLSLMDTKLKHLFSSGDQKLIQ